MGRRLAEGKLPPDLLERLLAYTSRGTDRTEGAAPENSASAPSIVVGAGAGEDAAVVRGERTLVLTADPITFTEERIGACVVAVNANDIVAMGGRPVYLTTTILLPPGTTDARLEGIFADIAAACRRADLAWVGGHTEVTTAVSRIVVSGHAVGFLRGPPLATGGARPGDAVAMSKWIGLEGTTIIARERPAESEEVLGAERHRSVLAWLDDPGLSIIAEGRALAGLALTAGHDPTEGGIAMGLYEMSRRSGRGIVVREEQLPVREETRLLCARFGLDPLGLLGSGVFLFAAAPAVVEEACRRLAAAGIPAARIGEVLGPGDGMWMERGGRRQPLAASAQDEIVKLSRSPAGRGTRPARSGSARRGRPSGSRRTPRSS